MEINNLSNHILTAARIALEFTKTPDYIITCLDDIERSTRALSIIECKPGFNWEDQFNDWETICASIAATIEKGNNDIPRDINEWSLLILKLLK